MSGKFEDETGAFPKGELAEAGYVDLGHFAIPREKLKLMLPDFARFERTLPLAMKDMEYAEKHDGATSPWFFDLDEDTKKAIVATMRELGEIYSKQANELEGYLRLN